MNKGKNILKVILYLFIILVIGYLIFIGGKVGI